MNNRIIITGGSGFIGTNLIDFYLERGWEVVNFDIAQPRNPAHLHHWYQIDILDQKKLIREINKFKPSVLLHFAARTDLNEKINLDGYAANIDGVSNIIESIKASPSIERVVFASSQLVCQLGYIPKNDCDYKPSTLYGESKVLTERIIRAADNIDATWSIIRPTSIWGPWFDIPYKNFFQSIALNQYVHPGDIKIEKQWGFVGNSVYQVNKLVEAPPEFVDRKMFYLADYQPILLRDFADHVQQAIGSNLIISIPPVLLQTAGFLGDISQKLGWKNPPITTFRYHNIITSEIQDLQPLESLVGPLPFTFDQGIQLTVKWLRDYGYNNKHESFTVLE